MDLGTGMESKGREIKIEQQFPVQPSLFKLFTTTGTLKSVQSPVSFLCWWTDDRFATVPSHQLHSAGSLSK